MSRFVVIIVLCLAMLVLPAAPIRAYDDEVHYGLTFYIARRVGFTHEQAWRIASACVQTDYAYDTEPVQMHLLALVFEGAVRYATMRLLVRAQPLAAIARVLLSNLFEMPSSAYNVGPRLRFHAFGVDPDVPWEELTVDEQEAFTQEQRTLISQRQAILWRDAIAHKNLGVFLHFWQDLIPHTGYGAAYGHYDLIPLSGFEGRMAATLPQGPLTDWLAYPAARDRRHLDALAGDEERAALYRGTAELLSRYMVLASGGRQQPLPWTVDGEAIATFVFMNPNPSVGRFQNFDHLIQYKRESQNFRPRLENAGQAVNTLAGARRDAMEKTDLPRPLYDETTDQIRASRNKLWPSWTQTTDFYLVDPDKDWAKGETGAEDTRWVLWRDLTVNLVYPEDYTPQHSFEVVVLLPATQAAEQEYELRYPLVEPTYLYLAGDQPAVFRDIPVGEVIVELQRLDEEQRGDGRRTTIRSRRIDTSKTDTVTIDVIWPEDRQVFFLPGDSQLIDERLVDEAVWMAGADAPGMMTAHTPGYRGRFSAKEPPSSTGTAGMFISAHLFVVPDAANRIVPLDRSSDEAMREFQGFVGAMSMLNYFSGVPERNVLRRNIGVSEVVFTYQPDSSSPPRVLGFYLHQNIGLYMVELWGEAGGSLERLLGEWDALKPRMNALMDERWTGLTREERLRARQPQ